MTNLDMALVWLHSESDESQKAIAEAEARSDMELCVLLLDRHIRLHRAIHSIHDLGKLQQCPR